MGVGFFQGIGAEIRDIKFFYHLAQDFLAFRRRMQQSDQNTAGAIASGAKARAPDDTGRLVNGITTDTSEPVMAVSAHAISPDGKHADYALFVEKGHGVGVADGDYFEGDGGAALRASRHRQVEPHPFFYPAIEDPLRRRWQAIEAGVADYFGQLPAGDRS